MSGTRLHIGRKRVIKLSIEDRSHGNRRSARRGKSGNGMISIIVIWKIGVIFSAFYDSLFWEYNCIVLLF
jgi:hypothetical protein